MMTFKVRTTTPGSRVEIVKAADRNEAMQQAARIFGSAPLVVEEFTPLKGMLVSVLRSADGDFTNGGISSKFTRFVLCGPGIPELFEPTEQTPALIYDRRRGGSWQKASPIVRDDKGMVGPMFGGNYVTSSDSRFNEATGGQPIAVHDRFETAEQYRMLST